MSAAADPANVISPVLLSTGLSRAAGGPFFSVSGLARALAETGDCVPRVVGSYFDDAAWEEDARQWTGIALTASRGRGLRSASTLARDAGAAVSRARAAGGNVVLHVSGLWDAASLAAASVTRSGRLPYAVSPRGMLEPWALGHKRVRKKIALLLWQHALLANADLLHATSDLECHSIRAAGLRNPVCVIPNGIEPAAAPARPCGGPLRCVFLSRIHPKKGLPLLLEAWSRVRPVGWTLDIAGHVQDQEHERELQRLIAAHRLEGVTIVGERSGPDKWAFLGAADLFVLPSHSENFGIVVAEAMAAGLPVITTTGTPWRVLADEAMGWCVAPAVEPLATALREAVSEPGERRAARGRRARAYALDHFGWPDIGRRMAACYRWMAGCGPATPDIVFASS